MYPAESYEFSNIGPGGAGATGQSPPEFSATCGADGGYPTPAWDPGLLDAELSSSLDSPETTQGEGAGPQPLGHWNSEAQAYPALVGGTIAMADPMSQYIPVGDLDQTYYAPRDITVTMADSISKFTPVEDLPGGCYDSLKWPLPRATSMEQTSPSPSLSSYYISSPASGGGAHSSRDDSCSSLPALKTSEVEHIRSDARLRPVPTQALSPDVARSSLAGKVAANGPYPSRESSASAQNNTSPATTTTPDHSAGIVSPATTVSPSDRSAIFADQRSGPQPARHEPDQQGLPRTSRKHKALAPARRKKQQDAETQAQAQAQQQQQQQPAPKARNRDAANKCRAKNKQAVAELESAERAMSAENHELCATARGLRDEVLALKNALLAHGNCDDKLIQQYLTNQARRVGYGQAQQVDHARLYQHQHQQREGREHAQ